MVMRFSEWLLNESSFYFSVNINHKLRHLIIGILKEKGYKFEENDTIEVTPKNSSERVNSFQDMLFSSLTDLFNNGDKELIDFVGSTEIGDFIDADLGLEVEMYKK